MEVKVGNIYKHFKGHIVEVLNIGRDSSTLEEVVIYKHLENGDIWVRPMKEFISEVDHLKYPEVKQKYRFELQEIESKNK